MVIAYGRILVSDLLEAPRLGCINVHASLLPKYRGAAPIHWAIIEGETKTGVCTMQMDEGMDTGDVLLRRETDIPTEQTTAELWDRLANMGAELLVETLPHGTPSLRHPKITTVPHMHLSFKSHSDTLIGKSQQCNCTI